MRIRIMGLCLVAVFAFAAVTSSAFGLAYFHGKKAPLVELKAGEKIEYKLKSKEAFLKGGATITCKTSKGTGFLEGPDLTNKIHISYSKCVAPGAGSVKCQTAGAKAGEIKTEELVGKLTEASETKGGETKIANKLTPGAGASKNLKGESQFAVFSCGPEKELPVNVTKTILALVSPQTGDSKKPHSINNEKTAEAEPKCGKQQLLYEATGGCEALLTEGGTSWNVSDTEETFKEFIEVK
jgi:hypothetical protein